MSTLQRQWESIIVERPRTVLLVDDEEDICESLKSLLEARLPGVRVLTALSGRQALELLEREPVDLIIADYKMPGMDGLTFLREATRVAPRVPRFMMTAYPDLELVIRAVNEGGVQKFMKKPLKPEIAEYVRVALMDQRQQGVWDRSFAIKTGGRGPPPSN